MTSNDIIEWVSVTILGCFTGYISLFLKLDEASTLVNLLLAVINIVSAMVLVVYNLIQIKRMIRERKDKGESEGSDS